MITRSAIWSCALGVLLSCTKETVVAASKEEPAAALDALIARSERNRAGKAVGELVQPIDAEDLARMQTEYESDASAFLFLDDLTALDVPTAEALAKWRGHTLVLNGLTSMTMEPAARLAAWPGKRLFLDGLPDLDPGAAGALAMWPGRLLSVRGARAINPASAQALAKFRGFVAVAVGPARDDEPAIREISREELKALSQAIVSGRLPVIAAYLEKGGSPDASERGTTLLMEAAYFKQFEIAKLLVAKGAAVNAKNEEGRTALLYALDYPFGADVPKNPAAVLSLVTLLLASGADPNLAADELPLMKAAELGDLAVVDLLLSRGADPKAKSSRGYSALISAINQGQTAVAARLIKAGAEVNPVDPPRAGVPLLQAVSQSGSSISMFVYQATSKGAKPDAARVQAMEKNASAMIDLLLDAGASIEVVDERGWSPLMSALNAGVPALVEKVLARGANLEKRDKKGDTPLHFLAGVGRLTEPDLLPLAQVLVKRGADRKAKSGEGATAREIAEKRGFTKLAAALKD